MTPELAPAPKRKRKRNRKPGVERMVDEGYKRFLEKRGLTTLGAFKRPQKRIQQPNP